MVQNEYQNIVLFILSALLLTTAVFVFSKKISKNNKFDIIKRLLCYWGRNSIFFIGFNYLFNIVLNFIFKILKIQSKKMYCILDIIIVTVGIKHLHLSKGASVI